MPRPLSLSLRPAAVLAGILRSTGPVGVGAFTFAPSAASQGARSHATGGHEVLRVAHILDRGIAAARHDTAQHRANDAEDERERDRLKAEDLQQRIEQLVQEREALSVRLEQQKKFYEDALEQTRKEVQDLEGQIQVELGKVKRVLAINFIEIDL